MSNHSNHFDFLSLFSLLAVCGLMATIPSVGYSPFLVFLAYGGICFVLPVYVFLLFTSKRVFGVSRPLGDLFSDAIPVRGESTKISLIERFRNIGRIFLLFLWRNTSWPLFIPLLVYKREIFRRALNENKTWTQSNEARAIFARISPEPWIAIFCFGQAIGALFLHHNNAYLRWIQVAVAIIVTLSVACRYTYYIIDTDLPTSLRRHYEKPYIVFMATALLDFVALVIALMALRSSWTGVTNTVIDAVGISKAMLFGSSELKALVIGDAVHYDLLICEIAGKIWSASIVKFFWKFPYFRRTNDDRREAAVAYIEQGRFNEALQQIQTISGSQQTGEDKFWKAVCTLCLGKVEDGIILLNKYYDFCGEEKPNDDEFFKFLLNNLITGSPISSPARIKLIQYVAKTFGDIVGVMFLDRAALDDRLERKDAEAMADFLDREGLKLTKFYSFYATGRLRKAQEVLTYEPKNRKEAFIKEFILASAEFWLNTGPLQNRIDFLGQKMLTFFESAESYSEDEIKVISPFLENICVFAAHLESSHASKLYEIKREYEQFLINDPSFVSLGEQRKGMREALGDYLKTSQRAARIEDAVDNVFMRISSLPKDFLTLVTKKCPARLRQYHASILKSFNNSQ